MAYLFLLSVFAGCVFAADPMIDTYSFNTFKKEKGDHKVSAYDYSSYLFKQKDHWKDHSKEILNGDLVRFLQAMGTGKVDPKYAGHVKNQKNPKQYFHEGQNDLIKLLSFIGETSFDTADEAIAWVKALFDEHKKNLKGRDLKSIIVNEAYVYNALVSGDKFKNSWVSGDSWNKFKASINIDAEDIQESSIRFSAIAVQTHNKTCPAEISNMDFAQWKLQNITEPFRQLAKYNQAWVIGGKDQFNDKRFRDKDGAPLIHVLNGVRDLDKKNFCEALFNDADFEKDFSTFSDALPDIESFLKATKNKAIVLGDRPTKLLKILDDNDDLLKNIQTFYKDKESIANKNVVIEQIKTKIKSYRKSAIDPASQGEFLYWMAGLANKADLEEALLSQEQNAILKIRIKFDELTNLEEDFDYGPYTVSVENKKLYIQNGDRGIKLPLDKSLKNHINKRATAEVIAKYKKLFFIEDNKEKAERKERINELEINKKKLEDMKEPLIKPDYWDQYEKLIKAFKEWDHIENNKERPFHQNAGSGLTNADVVFQCLAEIRSLRDGIITRDNLVALKTIFVDTLTQDKKSIIRLKNGLEANASKKEPSLAKKIIDTLVLNRGNITAAIEKRLVINNFDVKPLLKNINLNDPSDDDGW